VPEHLPDRLAQGVARHRHDAQGAKHGGLGLACPRHSPPPISQIYLSDTYARSNIKGRTWLATQGLPFDERAAAAALLRQIDFYAQELALIDAGLGQAALGRSEMPRLMTIRGVSQRQ
jgi:hypothetical protein